MSDEFNVYALNTDMCPESDVVLTNTTCSGCQFYKGFQMINGFPCINCGYYSDSKPTDNSS